MRESATRERATNHTGKMMRELRWTCSEASEHHQLEVSDVACRMSNVARRTSHVVVGLCVCCTVGKTVM